MNTAQIKHMVSRFLQWKLPENFNPDGGISFKPTYTAHPAHAMKHEPFGTNLLDAAQAEAMVRHMVEGLPGHASEGNEVRADGGCLHCEADQGETHRPDCTKPEEHR